MQCAAAVSLKTRGVSRGGQGGHVPPNLGGADFRGKKKQQV